MNRRRSSIPRRLPGAQRTVTETVWEPVAPSGKGCARSVVLNLTVQTGSAYRDPVIARGRVPKQSPLAPGIGRVLRRELGGKGDAAIVHVDVSLYVMTPEFGAASQLEKIDMLDFADFVAINKFDRKGAQDALRDVRKQYQRNRELFKPAPGRDAGVRHDGVAVQRRWRHRALPGACLRLAGTGARALAAAAGAGAQGVRRAKRHRAAGARRYLAEIAETVRGYHRWALEGDREPPASGSSCAHRRR